MCDRNNVLGVTHRVFVFHVLEEVCECEGTVIGEQVENDRTAAELARQRYMAVVGTLNGCCILETFINDRKNLFGCLIRGVSAEEIERFGLILDDIRLGENRLR